MKTQAQLKQVALDLFHNRIFTDRHCRSTDELSMVFALLMLMDEKDRERLQKNPPGMIYEYYEKAAPRTCNGLPMFFSFHILSEEEAKTVLKIYDKLKAATTEALK